MEAAGDHLRPRREIGPRDGLALAFRGVTRDDRRPAALDRDAPGSASVSLTVATSDDRGNRRSRDLEIEIPKSHRVIAFQDERTVVLAGLSGDSAVDLGDLVLSPIVVVVGAT